MAGSNSGTLVGIFPKVTMTFRKLNKHDTGIILRLFNKAENLVDFYNPDLEEMLYNVSCYSNDQEYEQNNYDEAKGWSCAVISNKRREFYE